MVRGDGGRRLPRGIFKRGRIYWISYAIEPHRMKYESTGSPHLRHAKNLLATRQDEVFRAKKYPELTQSDRTLGEVVAHYVKHIQTKPSAFQFKQRLSDALLFLGEETLLREVSFGRLDDWTASLYDNRKIQPQSVRLYLGALRAACSYAKRSRLTNYNPMTDYDIPKGKKKRRRVATEEEIALILEYCERHRKDEYRLHMRAAVILAIETGMRRAEISALRWSWIDLRNRIIRIPQEVTKTDEPRSVPVTKSALAVLRARPKDPIVDQTKIQITDKFCRLTRELEIHDLHFHDLRHTRATSWVKAGVPEAVVQEILGHESVEMTRHYTNLTEKDLREAIDRLDQASLH